MRSCHQQPRIAIVIEIFAAPGEKGYSRFRSIAEQFVTSGYDVTVICSDFIHADKTKRRKGTLEAANLPYKVVELEEPGYKKNISLQRVYSQAVFSKKVRKYFRTHRGQFDCVYSTMPDNYTAYVSMSFAEEEGIPGVIDVEDLIPEGFKQVFNVPVISDLAFLPWRLVAEATYRKARGVIGSSNEYRDRPFLNKDTGVPRKTVYVGIDLDAFDAGAKLNAGSFDKPRDELWVTYTGTLGTSYDLKTPISAVAALRAQGKNVVLKLAGDGPLREELEQYAQSLATNGAEFLGYLPYGKMAALLCASDVAINSFGARAPQSIVNKVGDYFAAGVSVVSTCPSEEFRELLDQTGSGLNVLPESVEDLTAAIGMLYCAPPLRAEMGKRARRLAEDRFDRKSTYPSIVEMMDGLRGR